MGKPRVCGSTAKISVHSPDGKTEIFIGDVEKFSAKQLGELKKHKVLGNPIIGSQVVHEGWDLSFEGGKVDWNLAMLIHAQDEAISEGKTSPLFTVTQRVKYSNQMIEEFSYSDVTIHGYEIDVPFEEVTEKFSGFSGNKRSLTSASDKMQPRSNYDNVSAMIKTINDTIIEHT